MAIELQVAKACEHEKIPPVGWFNDWFEIVLDQVGDPRRNLEVSVRTVSYTHLTLPTKVSV